MGLDMYLKATRFLWSFPTEGPDAQLSKQVAAICAVPDYNVKEIVINAAYWRKANQIHGWFVSNVQNGEDNCATYEVRREKLETLLRLAETVLKNPKSASTILPVQEGFFFGSREYGEGYFEYLRDTVEQLKKALSLSPCWTFEYKSSW